MRNCRLHAKCPRHSHNYRNNAKTKRTNNNNKKQLASNSSQRASANSSEAFQYADALRSFGNNATAVRAVTAVEAVKPTWSIMRRRARSCIAFVLLSVLVYVQKFQQNDRILHIYCLNISKTSSNTKPRRQWYVSVFVSYKMFVLSQFIDLIARFIV